MDSPLLSYIDIWQANLLPPFLTVGEAWYIGPCFVRAGSLEPIRDALAETVSKNRSIHQLVERPESLALVQVAEPAAAESVHSSGAESDPGEDEMVTRRVMTIDRFMLGARPTTQQQEPQGKDSTPPPPPPLAAFGKDSAPSSNHLWVQGMPPQELPTECLG